jgi:hypothetical protein
MHKLLRAIRLDASDTFVFERACAAGEWVVSGSFMFWEQDLTALAGRQKQAFRAGFLGLASFGWSTLAVVVAATDAEREAAIDSLSAYLLAEHGAPTLDEARAAAIAELDFTAGLAQHPVQTLVAVHRTVTADGEIAEQFRTFRSADAKQATAMPCSAGAFAVVEDEQADVTADGDHHFNLAAAAMAERGT